MPKPLEIAEHYQQNLRNCRDRCDVVYAVWCSRVGRWYVCVRVSYVVLLGSCVVCKVVRVCIVVLLCVLCVLCVLCEVCDACDTRDVLVWLCVSCL